MKQVKKFDPLSVMKIAAICYGMLGLVEGVFFASFISLQELIAPGSRAMSVLVGALLIVAVPIFAALMGAIIGGLGAAIYNVSAKYVGGIRVEVEEEPVPVAGAL